MRGLWISALLVACNGDEAPEAGTDNANGIDANQGPTEPLIGVVEEAVSRPGLPRSPGPKEVDGMVPVDGGWTLLGPKTEHGGPQGGGPMGQPGPPPGPSAEDHQTGGRERGSQGPPPVGDVTPLTGLQVSNDPKTWESFGGMLLEPRLVWVRPFQIDATEVTRSQYQAFLEDTGYRPPFGDEAWANEGWNWNKTVPPEGTADHPVVLTNWYDAVEFCLWAGKRLPTEAEWQRAALGTMKQEKTFPWEGGYDPNRLNHGKMAEPNFDDSDGWLYTSPVGQYPLGRSETGMDDAFGNAWEFTADWRKDDWDDAVGTEITDGWVDVQMNGPGIYVAVRGGAYFFDIAPNPAGERNHFLPELRRKTSGFRCAK